MLELCAPLPVARMLSAVDGKDDDVSGGLSKIDSVREPIEESAPCLATDAPKPRRVPRDLLDGVVQALSKGSAEPRLSTFVPVARFEHFGGSLGSKDDPACHSRSVSFRRTSSHGIADSGR